MSATAHSLVNLNSLFDRTASPSPYPSDEISTICVASLLLRSPSNNPHHCGHHCVCDPMPDHQPHYPFHIHHIPRFDHGISFYNVSAIVISIDAGISMGSSVCCRWCAVSIPSLWVIERNTALTMNWMMVMGCEAIQTMVDFLTVPPVMISWSAPHCPIYLSGHPIVMRTMMMTGMFDHRCFD